MCADAAQTLDASPSYLLEVEVAERIRLAFPDQQLKLIVMLRDPIARAYSMYQMADRAKKTKVMRTGANVSKSSGAGLDDEAHWCGIVRFGHR